MSTKEKWMKKTGAYPASDARDADTLAKVTSSGGQVEEKSILVHESLRGAAGVRTAGGPTPPMEVVIDPNEEIDNDILRQYEFNQLVGRGTYGVVWKARSKATRKHVAFKKLFHCWRNQTDAQRTYREIMYLHAFNGHDNAAKLREVMRSKDTKHLYLIFEYMGADLFMVARAQILQENHKQYVTYQIMKFLKYIHSSEVIHRDLKPSNITISENCHVRVGDFGMMRSVDGIGTSSDVTRQIMTDYCAPRWYRAPEMIVGAQRYGKPVDMWGLGCVVAELINGKPVAPGIGALDQLSKILAITGRPTPEDIASTDSPFAGVMMGDVRQPEPISLSEMFPKASAEALDLMRLLFQFNPKRRLTVEKALRHPYVVDFHNPDDEPLFPDGALQHAMEDNIKFKSTDYKERLFQDMKKYHKQKLTREWVMPPNFMTS
jgi:mitogen-activated protein kinase 15